MGYFLFVKMSYYFLYDGIDLPGRSGIFLVSPTTPIIAFSPDAASRLTQITAKSYGYQSHKVARQDIS